MTPEEKKAYNRAYYLKNRERLLAYQEQYRVEHPDCRKGEKKRYRERHPERVKEEAKKYYWANKGRRQIRAWMKRDEVKARHRAYQAKKREQIRAQRKEYRLKNRAKILAAMRAWTAEHPDANRLWRLANPDRVKAISLRKYNARRARRLGAQVGADRDAYRDFLRRLKRTPLLPCYWCGRLTTARNRHADHIIPLARGGKDDVHNLCCSCARCNCRKQDKLPEEFTGQGVLPLG